MAEEKPKKSRYNEKVNKATQEFIKNNYDNFMLRLQKGKKDKFKEV